MSWCATRLFFSNIVCTYFEGEKRVQYQTSITQVDDKAHGQRTEERMQVWGPFAPFVVHYVQGNETRQLAPYVVQDGVNVLLIVHEFKSNSFLQCFHFSCGLVGKVQRHFCSKLYSISHKSIIQRSLSQLQSAWLLGKSPFKIALPGLTAGKLHCFLYDGGKLQRQEATSNKKGREELVWLAAHVSYGFTCFIFIVEPRLVTGCLEATDVCATISFSLQQRSQCLQYLQILLLFIILQSPMQLLFLFLCTN